MIVEMLKVGISTAFGALVGARLAQHLQREEKLADEKGMVLRRIELMREALAQSVAHIEQMVVAAKQGQSAGLRLILADEYFRDIPYELFLKHLGREHVDAIKDLTRNVIPSWNKLATGPNQNDAEVVSNLCVLANRGTLTTMRSVIHAFERDYPELGKTTVRAFKYEDTRDA